MDRQLIAPTTMHIKKQIKLIFSLSALLIFTFSSFTNRIISTPSLSSTDSIDIKIGQMILIGINDIKSISENDSLLSDIQLGKVGGIILFEKNISPTDSKNKLILLISELQKKARIPLFATIDEEGGKVHRLKEKYGFVRMPSAAYLGRINNVDTTLFYNRRLAKELRELGINLNFAPVLDMAINPENKAIVKVERSFSASPEMVSKHALVCIQAHHEFGIKTILKHFPGHGSSTSDSHFGIVDVSRSWNFNELFPYYSILQSGTCDAIMTAHIINQNWDTTLLPATLSKKVIQEMLRGWMGYRGVIFSDDMQMNAISKNYGFETSIEKSINAGVDVLMFGNNVHLDEKPATAKEVHAIIKKLLKEGKIKKERIDEAYYRIMALKNKK